jgi:hypothetical protein
MVQSASHAFVRCYWQLTLGALQMDMFLTGCDALLESIQVKTTAEVQARTVQELIALLIPERSGEFLVQVNIPPNPQNVSKYFHLNISSSQV